MNLHIQYNPFGRSSFEIDGDNTDIITALLITARLNKDFADIIHMVSDMLHDPKAQQALDEAMKDVQL